MAADSAEADRVFAKLAGGGDDFTAEQLARRCALLGLRAAPAAALFGELLAGGGGQGQGATVGRAAFRCGFEVYCAAVMRAACAAPVGRPASAAAARPGRLGSLPVECMLQVCQRLPVRDACR